MKQPSAKALDLLYKYEVGGGEAYYNKFLKKFTWPGRESGPTIGIGIDTAYYNASEISCIFDFLKEDQIKLIQGGKGKTGLAGKEYTKTLLAANIEVSWDQATKIFKSLTWPKYATAAERTFPGLIDLEDDAYGAIVSLVFNRGTSLVGDSRKEMRNIKSLIPDKAYETIAEEVIKMKRIWKDKDLDGLLARRDAEAELIKSCA
jgi:GH24 family phage-related lysozyme (muramidase)